MFPRKRSVSTSVGWCKSTPRYFPLVHDADRNVRRDGDPDLHFNGIFPDVVEPLDPKMLLDQLNGQFDRLATTIQGCDGLAQAGRTCWGEKPHTHRVRPHKT